MTIKDIDEGMKKRITRKSRSSQVKNEALRNIRKARQGFEEDQQKLLDALKDHILENGILGGSSVMPQEQVDKQKSMATVLKLMELTDSEDLKKEIRKALARSLH